MSSNLPQSPFAASSQDNAVGYSSPTFVQSSPPFREWLIAISLFSITLVTTTLAGFYQLHGFFSIFFSIQIFLRHPILMLDGLTFSIPLMLILLAHELGHFFACRYYGMRCTPPFFIPLPFPPAGTFGAFIKIKSPFRNRRALFDIGVAGPLAGFLLAVPFLWIGIGFSRIIPKSMIPAGELGFGEPLLLRLFAAVLLEYSPDKQEMIAHPFVMAAWVGLLATSLNLLPIWQLDGGHIAYAILGRMHQKRLSVYCLAALILLSFWGWPTPSYLLFAVLLLVIGMRLRFYHPPTMADDEGLGTGRVVIGILALLILIVSFIPIPISIS